MGDCCYQSRGFFFLRALVADPCALPLQMDCCDNSVVELFSNLLPVVHFSAMLTANNSSVGLDCIAP